MAVIAIYWIVRIIPGFITLSIIWLWRLSGPLSIREGLLAIRRPSTPLLLLGVSKSSSMIKISLRSLLQEMSRILQSLTILRLIKMAISSFLDQLIQNMQMTPLLRLRKLFSPGGGSRVPLLLIRT